MLINDILQLDKTSQSIKKIDLFLAGCDKKSSDYYKAIAYRSIIMHSLGKTNDALKNLYQIIANYGILSDDSIVAICDSIIKITLDVKRFDQTKKYIDLKSQFLKVSQSHLHTKDLINYYVASLEYSKANKLLINYLNETSDKIEEQWALEIIVDIYFKEYQYDKFLEACEKLEKIYLDNLNMVSLTNLLCRKLQIYYNQGNYIKLIGEANRYLNEYELTPTNKLEAATLLINCYVISKDYRRAAIIESNYEEYIKECSNNVSLEFAKAALKLYKETNSLVSIQQYETLIKNLESNSKTVKSKKDKNIVIPNISIEDEYYSSPILEKVVGKRNINSINENIKNVKTVYISQMYDKLSNLFSTINNLDMNTKFREIFRITGIELQKIIRFNEMYLLNYNNGYTGLHYKKERAYDKRLEFSDIENTINLMAINYEQEIYLDPDSEEGIKNIVTSEIYVDKPYAVSFPLFKEEVPFGSLTFYSDEAFLQEDMVYEVLKLVVQMLNSRLVSIINQQELENSNKRMFFVYENMALGVKEIMDNNIHLSKQAVAILGTIEDLLVPDYEVHIHSLDLGKYREALSNAYKYLRSETVEYRFKKHNDYIKIKEAIYPSYNNGIVSIYSILEDITKIENTKNELINLAYMHPISKLDSELKLIVDIDKEIETKKFSLCLIDIKDFKLYSDLYGMNFANQLIYAVAKELKEAFSSEFMVSIYHIESDRYAILLRGINDRRVVDSIINKKLELISKKLNMLNSRLNVFFNCGCFRVAKNSPILDSEKVIGNAYEALTDSKRVSILNHNICHYDSDRAKIRFNENQLVTHISEAIDHGKIGLSYKQVADLENNSIFAYYTSLSLDNYEIDETFMNKVIERRNLEELLDKYAISNASKESKMLYEELKALVPIFVNISDKSLTNTLPSFIEQQDRFYHFTKRNLIFVVKDAKNPVVKGIKELGYKLASSNLNDLLHKRIDYFILDYNENDNMVIEEIKNICNEKECILVLSGIDTKEDIETAINMNIPYIFGKYYKKSIRIKKLIDINTK